MVPGSAPPQPPQWADGKKWLRVTNIDEKQSYAEDTFSITTANWKWTDENGKQYEMTCKPLLRCSLCGLAPGDGVVGLSLDMPSLELPYLSPPITISS